MKKLTTLFAILLIAGCVDEQEKIRDVKYQAENNPVVVIDSCEYLTYRTYGGCAEFTHKGNCIYCAARNKK